MIYAYFGQEYEDFDKELMENGPSWFDNNYEDDWLYDPFVINMVKGVDKSELIGHNVISPVLGSISIRDLSGGVKTLISIYKEEKDMIYDIHHCGNNCAKYLIEIGKIRDIYLYISYLMDFCGEFDMMCVNNGIIIKNEEEYRNTYYDIR